MRRTVATLLTLTSFVLMGAMIPIATSGCQQVTRALSALDKVMPYLIEAQQLVALADQVGEQWISTTNPDPEIASQFRDYSQGTALALNTAQRTLNTLHEFDQDQYEEVMKPVKEKYDALVAFLKEHRVFGSSRLGAEAAPDGELRRPQAFDYRIE